MDKKRRSYKNKIIIEIKDIENFITRNTEAISYLKKSNLGIDFIQNQISKIKISLEEKKELLVKKEKELKGIEEGFSDNNINKKYSNDLINKQKNDSDFLKKKKEKTDEKNKNKEVYNSYMKDIINISRSERQNKRDYKNCLKYFEKVSEQLPDYIKKNLLDMPNNKGYIWKGVWFFGAKPQKDYDKTMSMYELCGKKTFIRNKDQNGVWNITLKQKKPN